MLRGANELLTIKPYPINLSLALQLPRQMNSTVEPVEELDDAESWRDVREIYQ